MDTDAPSGKLKQRLLAVDLLRGIVMMIMLLDHVRDFVHAGAPQSDPTDLSSTTIPIFFTRWITHFCAPIFVFLSGVSIYLQKSNGRKSNAELSRFLLTRGLWLILLEFTLIRFLIVFNLDYSFFGMAQVIWVIGVSMIVMAALVYLPVKVVGIAGLLMIVLHNVADGIQVPPNIAFAGTPPPVLGQSLWMVLHQPGIIPLFGGSQLFVAYPLIPWIGVMMAGYALGSVYSWEADRRRQLLLRLGLAVTVLFIVLRFVNIYGDPSRWITPLERPAVSQSEDPAIDEPPPNPRGTEYTFLSFLNTTKYPPSLLFLLMTLGPALLVLALADGIDGASFWQRVCINFGRVPFFFYLLQWVVAHSAGVLLGLIAGVDVSYLFRGLFEMGQTAPPGHGFPLWVVYATWITGLIVLYPLCAYYGKIKRRSQHWVFSYL
jgi:uncharacterized membrane protein